MVAPVEWLSRRERVANVAPLELRTSRFSTVYSHHRRIRWPMISFL